MGAARAVTGLAADAELAPGRMVGVGGQVESLAQIGNVAIDAHEVRRLLDAGPVQGIADGELLAGIEVEPALASRLLGP